MQLVATAVMLAVAVVGGLIARWLGWQLIAEGGPDSVTLQVGADGDGDGVRILAPLVLLVGGVGVAALVMAVVLAARTRVLVAAGATRRSVAIGQLLTVAVMTAYVLAVSAVVAVVVGTWGGVAELLGADGAGELAVVAVRGLGAVLMALVAGITITTVFLRWPWWVGVLGLLILGVVGPGVVGVLAPGVGGAVGEAFGWPWFDLVAAVVVAAGYWVIVRRVPVP